MTGPESFWELLENGTNAVTEVPADRWDAEAFYDPDPMAPGRMPTKWGAYLNDIAGFDADFFGITPREAAAMDPPSSGCCSKWPGRHWRTPAWHPIIWARPAPR